MLRFLLLWVDGSKKNLHASFLHASFSVTLGGWVKEEPPRFIPPCFVFCYSGWMGQRRTSTLHSSMLRFLLLWVDGSKKNLHTSFLHASFSVTLGGWVKEEPPHFIPPCFVF